MPYVPWKQGEFVAASKRKGLSKEWQKMIADTVRQVDAAIANMKLSQVGS